MIFAIDQLSPDCRYVGKFLVRAQAGRNRVRFRGRLRGRMLEPGTYRLTARPRRAPARRLTGVTVVIVERTPAPEQIAAARASNVCPDGVPPSVSAASQRDGAANPESKKTSGVAGVQASRPPRDALREDSGSFGAGFGTVSAAARSVPPMIFALGLLAILLLGVAAMPQPIADSRAGAALAHHRGTFALAGVAVLVAALLSFAVSQ